MDILSIIILGLVQGVTETIPLSSKTQDALVYLKVLHGDPSLTVPILLYLNIGSVLATLFYFRKDVLEMTLSLMKKPLDIKTHAEGKIGFIFTALLLTGIIGVPLLLAEKKFFPALDLGFIYGLMGAGLIITGMLLLLQKGAKVRQVGAVTWKDGILTGVMQGFSILPGISRSGTSTTALIWRGFDSESSFHLSFLLSIPTIMLAELVLYSGGLFTAFPVKDGLLLALSAIVFGYLTIGTILAIVKRVNLGYVALALGCIVIAAAYFGFG